jgi:hypothetical protein
MILPNSRRRIGIAGGLQLRIFDQMTLNGEINEKLKSVTENVE